MTDVDACAVFGERVAATDYLRDGDRVELLRSLLIDPKDARRRRAARR
jgi:putative ubiquitin-RnfH superfamily antitoxin RatB of RatAB toxin-antitoxin module